MDSDLIVEGNIKINYPEGMTRMDKKEVLKNIGVVAYMSYKYIGILRKNNDQFPARCLTRFGEAETFGGHDIQRLRRAIKCAKREPDYLVSELPLTVTHNYSLEEMKWYFDKWNEVMDNCRRPLEA